jgi:hypothetical protein
LSLTHSLTHSLYDEPQSEADFPAELAQFEEVLKIVADCNANRLRCLRLSLSLCR